MSFANYWKSRDYQNECYPFQALIMAAMRIASDDDIYKLRKEWPEIWTELIERTQAPGGVLEYERTKV